MNELDIQQYRRRRLQAAVDAVSDGNYNAFGRRLQYKDGAYVRQMVGGYRPITEKTIRAIEKLPRMAHWFSETSKGIENKAGRSATPIMQVNPDANAVRTDVKMSLQNKVRWLTEQLAAANKSGRLDEELIDSLIGVFKLRYPDATVSGRDSDATNIGEDRVQIGGARKK